MDEAAVMTRADDATRVTAFGQPQPGAGPTPAWPLSATGGNVWTVKPGMRKVTNAMARLPKLD